LHRGHGGPIWWLRFLVRRVDLCLAGCSILFRGSRLGYHLTAGRPLVVLRNKQIEFDILLTPARRSGPTVDARQRRCAERSQQVRGSTRPYIKRAPSKFRCANTTSKSWSSDLVGCSFIASSAMPALVEMPVGVIPSNQPTFSEDLTFTERQWDWNETEGLSDGKYYPSTRWCCAYPRGKLSRFEANHSNSAKSWDVLSWYVTSTLTSLPCGP
jgi:hypothetical protein